MLKGQFQALLALTDREFVEAAYRQILGREADASGLAHHLRLLQQGVSKLDVMIGILLSEEAMQNYLKI